MASIGSGPGIGSGSKISVNAVRPVGTSSADADQAGGAATSAASGDGATVVSTTALDAGYLPDHPHQDQRRDDRRWHDAASLMMSKAHSSFDLRETLRQMVAVLQEARQALAGLDLDGIMGSAAAKSDMCDVIEMANVSALDDECRGLLEAARKMNQVNRQVRHLIAANV
ncbi:hypothetical protein E4T56_gene3933, partial [Termitomyces sp. T112]